MNLKILTEASQLITICDAGINAPGVGTPCLPAHVSFSKKMIFHTVGRRYSSGNSILRGVPLFPASYSSIQQELLKANLACCYFVLPTSTSDDILSPVVHCLNAPEPPAEANLTLRDYDPLSPRRRGGHLNYTCSAGGHNKFASDYTKRRYTLTCNDDNNYETPNWPTCVSSRCCRQILFKSCLFFSDILSGA